VKFFFDNNLAIKLAHGLDQMVSPHHRVVHLRDEFLPNVEDAVWMNALAKEGSGNHHRGCRDRSQPA
jgi:hypothetical protein